MATTAVSSAGASNANSAADIAAANKAAAQKIITSLSAGSGVDTASLAQNLVNAEKVPQQNALNAKISKNDSRVSGYSAVAFVLSELNTAFTSLKDQTSFNSVSASNSQSSAFSVTTTTAAAVGNNEVEVLQLAKSQRRVSDGFTTANASLNGGRAMRLSFGLGSTDTWTPTLSTVQGQSGVTPFDESTAVTFKDMTVGQSVTVAGLTYTATQATSASEVATIFSGLNASLTTPANPSKGTFTGALTAFNSGVNAGGTLNFTSVLSGTNVADLLVSGAKTSISLVAGRDTPQDIADAINAGNFGVTASLVNTGDGSGSPFQLVLTGAKGAAGAFTLNSTYTAADGSISSTPSQGGAGVNFSGLNAADQTATDSRVKVNGITFTRSTNSLTDVLTGVTLDLKGTTTGVATLALARDTTAIKDKFTNLVTVYNDAMSMLGVVSDPKSTVETYGATLVGDSTVRSVRNQVRALVQGTSTTPGSNVGAMWQLGLKVDQNGVMSLDETKLDTALATNFEDVVKTMTGNTNGLSAYSRQPAGFAGEAVRKLTKLISATGPIVSNTQNAENQNIKYKEQLSKLDIRMTALLSRYTKQFAAMDSLVGSVNSQKTSLKSTFDGMMAAYTNK